MADDKKPEQILRLEQQLKLRLQPLRTGKVTAYQNRTCYQLDDRGEVVGLNLSFCSINDGTFPKGLTNLTALDLSDNRISDGSFLTGLTSLTTLRLSNNLISDGSFLTGLTNLTSLHLSDNHIRDGSFLTGLTNLTSLHLSDNHIRDGSFLTGLTSLTTLRLSNNLISDGSFLTGLTNLTALDLSGNRISDGSFLTGLTNLTALRLSNNLISDGSFLKSLTALTSLDLSGNLISDGSFLTGLTNLTSLDLSGNHISDWSFLKSLTILTAFRLSNNLISDGSFLTGLTNLTALDLSGNRISDGSFLTGLTNLTALRLSNNLISDGSFLKSLTALTSLDLRDNKLRTLPEELLRLNVELVWGVSTRSDTVNLAGNPIETPPLEIAKRGDQAIRAWFAEQKKGIVPLNEVKVILVGDGEAGKTTLRKRLMKLRPNKHEPQTHGIEIHPHKVRCGGVDIRVHFWDFGGQEILHATHQFFLSRRTLYIVVLDGRKEEDVDYWLKHIESFGGDSPVLLALNKLDQNPSFEVDRKTLRAKYPGIRDFYRLKCLDPNDVGVAQLLRELPEHLMQVELTRAEWPQRWFHVKEWLQHKKRPPFLERKEFEDFCRRKAGIADEVSQQTLIRFLSDLGVALHFEDTRLELLQILNPKWATQAVYRLISAPSVATAHGLLKLGDLRDILAKAKAGDYEYPREKHGYIVDLMRKFELCYDVKPEEVLLPDLLDVGEPKHEFPVEDVLRFRYEYDYLPKSIMPRLIVKRHTDIEDMLQWRTGVVLKPKNWNARARIRSDKSVKRITIEVAGPQRRDYFAVIFGAIETIHDSFTKLDVKRKVPLPDHPQEAPDYEDLIYHREAKQRYYYVGVLKKRYEVSKLLDGVDLVQRRTKRTSAPTPAVQITVIIGDNNQNVAVAIGDHITQAVADSIQDSFNRSSEARTYQLKGLLEQLALEMTKVIEKLSTDKVSEATADLKNVTEQAIAEKPSKRIWDFSMQGLIDAAAVAGPTGTVAINLIAQITKLLRL